MTAQSKEKRTSRASPSTLYGTAASDGDAKERILRTAYDLFSLHGVNAIGVDRITAEAGVAKMSLYRNFGSKEGLVLAVLERREQLWVRDWLETEVSLRGGGPGKRLLAFFDLFDAWFRDPGYEGCLFCEALLESGDHRSPIGAASVARLMQVRNVLRSLAEEAGTSDPGELAAEWQTLLWGATLGASSGDRGAAKRARKIAVLLLEREGIPS